MRLALLLLALIIAPAVALAQGSALQVGPVGQNHPAMWIANGQLADALQPTNNGFNGLLVTAPGSPVCIDDVPIATAGGYHQLCLGSTGLFWIAQAGATTNPVNIGVNGVTNISLSTTGPTLTNPTLVNPINVGTISNGLLSLLSNISVSGPLNASNVSLYMNGTRTGTFSGTDASIPLEAIIDTETVTNLQPSSGVDSLFIKHFFGTSAGSRDGLQVLLQQNAATTGVNAQHKFYTGIISSVNALTNDSGTTGSPMGQYYAYGGQMYAYPGATNLLSITGAELDVSIQAGANALSKQALFLVSLNSDAVYGSLYDVAIGIATVPGSHGFGNGIMFGRWDALTNPIATNGSLFGIYPGTALSTAYGVNLGNGTFANCAVKTPTVCLDSQIPLSVAYANIFIQGSIPTFEMWDSTLSPGTPPQTSGSIMRLTGTGVNPDIWEFQINTAAAGDFSSAFKVLRIFGNGTVALPNIGASPGGKNLVCIDNATKLLYQGTTSAC